MAMSMQMRAKCMRVLNSACGLLRILRNSAKRTWKCDLCSLRCFTIVCQIQAKIIGGVFKQQ